MNQYQQELGRLLKLSTLTPASYVPTAEVKNGEHAAVFVGGFPFLLTGPSDDRESVKQAEQFSRSHGFTNALRAFGLSGEPKAGTIRGSDIMWKASHSSIASSPSGHEETGTDSGPLMTIILGDNPEKAFAAHMSVNTELAQIIDPSAPVLDDGFTLGSLARN